MSNGLDALGYIEENLCMVLAAPPVERELQPASIPEWAWFADGAAVIHPHHRSTIP